MLLLEQAISTAFYKEKPHYSYWTGCSTGGRQGSMLAQRHSDLYDGIRTNAPAVYLGRLLPKFYWPQLTVKLLGYRAEQCELAASTQAAIAACDKLYGLQDGIIVDAGFVLWSDSLISAMVLRSARLLLAVRRSWKRLRRDRSTRRGETVVLAEKRCGCAVLCRYHCFTYWHSSRKSFCHYSGLDPVVRRDDPSFPVRSITSEQFFEILHQSRDQYAGIMDTGDTDLSFFNARGDKLISWQGAAGQTVFPKGNVAYLENVS